MADLLLRGKSPGPDFLAEARLLDRRQGLAAEHHLVHQAVRRDVHVELNRARLLQLRAGLEAPLRIAFNSLAVGKEHRLFAQRERREPAVRRGRGDLGVSETDWGDGEYDEQRPYFPLVERTTGRSINLTATRLALEKAEHRQPVLRREFHLHQPLQSERFARLGGAWAGQAVVNALRRGRALTLAR